MVDNSERRAGRTSDCGHAPPLVLTVREAAEVLRISKDLAYELIGRGELPALRLGRRLVVPVKPLLDLIDGPLETNVLD